MREIKFRAWDSESNRMIHQAAGLCEFFGDASAVSGYGNDNVPENITLMQFTGLKDKDGKELYEGDLVRLDHWNDDPKWIGYFEDGFRIFVDIGPVAGASQICNGWIIGNIYENSELLK